MTREQLISIVDQLSKANPYPIDVFPDCHFAGVGDALQKEGFNPDRIFAKFGRMVWNNCINQMKQVVADSE